MDRRTKFILLVVGALILFGLVGWFIVWPTLQPLFPARPASQQPPALSNTLKPPVNQPNPSSPSPSTPNPSTPPAVISFEPSSSPDAQVIADLARRAGVLAERVESGSSATGFSNLDDAQLDVSDTLAAHFRTMRTDLQKAHPASGTAYVTVARRLVERGATDVISGDTFNAIVQLQIQVRDGGSTSSAYREVTVTFTKTDENWQPSNYTAKAFTP